jgi:hypothetical protein
MTTTTGPAAREERVVSTNRVEVGTMIVKIDGHTYRVTADQWPNGWSYNIYEDGGCGVMFSRRDDYPTPKTAMLAGAKWINEC